jgi:signal transduction histidine kinase/HAMP domain-containing protein
MSLRQLSIRARLWMALAALTAATLIVGATNWVTLSQATARLERLHDETLTGVQQALEISRHASDLATRAPYLLTIQSPYRLRQEAENAQKMIADTPSATAEILAILHDMDDSIGDLVVATEAKDRLTDQILRLNASIAALERRYAGLASRLRLSLPEGRDWLTLQRMAVALIGAGRAENLVGVGEYQREFHSLSRRMGGPRVSDLQDGSRQLHELAEKTAGLFNLRRQQLTRQVEAEAALKRIRLGAEDLSLHAASTSVKAQAQIEVERGRTQSAINFAKSVIFAVGLISAIVALAAAIFVSRYVTANLRAISRAMERLAVGDRSTRLPRGTHSGDEIGKLFHAFRAFRANALRLDRLNRQLAHRNALFQGLYDGMPNGLAILSETGHLIACNARLADVTGLPEDAFKDRPDMYRLLKDAHWVCTHGSDGLTELHHNDGPVLELRESALATGGTVMLLSDVSERRALDDRMRQMQRTEALGKIAGEVAHDFGNILSTISTSLALIETVPPDRVPALRQSLGTALDIGTALTQRLLAFARRLNLEPEVMDLNTLVEGVEDLISLALTDQVTLQIHQADQPLMVRIDPGQMESALLNLCLNAAQAISGKGYIKISLGLASPDMAQIDVRDTGCGMSPDVLAHAMEPFFTARLDGTGTGLGLAMVHGFIHQSGGEVEITSKPDAGTLVRLHLPICSPVTPMRLDRRRILMIEDNPDDARHLRRLLSGATVIEATDPQIALRMIAEHPAFDIVLTDLHLGPDPAGWQIAEAALTRHPDTRVVVISGRLPAVNPLSAQYPDRAFSLSKPIDTVAFAALVQGPPHR